MQIGIIGAGAWGTALANVAADNGHDVLLWARESAVVDDINTMHTNGMYLPGSQLPPSIRATSDLADLAASHLLVNAIPTQHIRHTLGEPAGRALLAGCGVVNVAKGIEIGTHHRVSEIMADLGVSAERFAVLSGPSHAEEVVHRMPTTVVVAATDRELSVTSQQIFGTHTFRVYTTRDVVGVETCGALKNVIAIAAGIVDGLGLGDNTKAALMTRGLAEIARLGVALGADHQTFFGLAGMGDLIVTCDSIHSRNRFVGDQIGKGKTLDEVLAGMTAVAEGVPTTRAALQLAESVGVELPITEQVAAILFDGVDPKSAIRELMLRPTKDEWDEER